MNMQKTEIIELIERITAKTEKLMSALPDIEKLSEVISGMEKRVELLEKKRQSQLEA